MIDICARRAEFKARILARLEGKGIAPEQAEAFADEVVEAIWREYGGERVYFPKGTCLDPDQVWAEFNGRNHQKLARKFNCTVRRIERIVARKRAALRPKVTP